MGEEKWLPNKPENDESEDTQATNEDDNLQFSSIINIFPSIPGFSDCHEADIKAWLESDNDPGYQIMDDSDILNHVQTSQDIMDWYEKQKERRPRQLILLLRDLVAEKRRSNLKQTRINEFFVKV
ncbi:hypothetical protein QE152_g19954 [Popillia japonica]|uniref:Uncharacterized protein n=1 Tax=Popillia japonica TaxID=7064 RepID=A0AAW1KNU5_POPJA